MPSQPRRDRKTAAPATALHLGAEDLVQRQPVPQHRLPRQSRLHGWLQTLILSGPPPRRCRRWRLLRELRDEMND